MRCSCCDKELTEKEIIWNDELNDWEFCTTCLDVSLEAAYSDGFQREDEFDDLYVVDEPIYDIGDASDVIPRGWKIIDND